MERGRGNAHLFIAFVCLVTVLIALSSPAAAASKKPVAASSGALERYAATVRWYNPKLTWPQAVWVAGTLLRYSIAFGVDPRLVVAVIASESRFRHGAISPAGAIGFGQLMPGTAAGMGLNPRDPTHNIYGTVRKLRELLMRYRGRLDLTLAAYNAGTGAVAKYGGVPPYRETRNYVATVIFVYRYLASQPAWRVS
jgi:soluble lytic murein transglycosylase-like protein